MLDHEFPLMFLLKKNFHVPWMTAFRVGFHRWPGLNILNIMGQRHPSIRRNDAGIDHMEREGWVQPLVYNPIHHLRSTLRVPSHAFFSARYSEVCSWSQDGSCVSVLHGSLHGSKISLFGFTDLLKRMQKIATVT